jgi:hypothetical protein
MGDLNKPLGELRRRVRSVFFDVWNPIGVAPEGLPENEYDDYVAPVCSMLTDSAGCEREDLEAFLVLSEGDITDEAPDLARIRATVDMLLAIRINLRALTRFSADSDGE